MAEVLGVAASIAGLVSLADTAVRLGYKYIRNVKDAEKSVQSLVDEVNSLSGVLHSLNNVVEELEAADSTSHSFSKIKHINSCQTTLEKINLELENSIPEVKSIPQMLKWPFKKGTIAERLKEVQSHKSTMLMAMNARQMSALVSILANQEQLSKELAAITAITANLEISRLKTEELLKDDTLRKKLNLLSTIDVRKWQDSNARLREPGTGVWFTESMEFQGWISTDHSKLWVYGIPGAGKTILMASVIQEIEHNRHQSHGLGIFYCDYRDTQTHDPRNILGALARQLILQHENASIQLKIFCEKHGMTEHTQGSATHEDFCQFITDLSNNFTSTIIVVDGLDEVVGDRAKVARLLRSLDGSGTIKTLLASRDEVDIRSVLVDYPSISIAARSSDLRLYVHSEIEKRTNMRRLRIQDRSLKDHIVKVLTEGADGMFRWVACQMDYLCECSTDRDRREALRKLPPDLPKSYERILQRVNRSSKENQTLVKHTLLWVVYAVRPLTTTQLLQALAIRPGDKTYEKEYMTTLDELLNWCSSLIRKRSQSDGLELAHFTVKEYLLSLDESCSPALLQYRLSGDHTDIARTCINFLNFLKFDGRPTPVASIDMSLPDFDEAWEDFDEAWEDFEEEYPFMEHALQEWPAYVHKSSWYEIADEVLLLFDEGSIYRLWTFAIYYYCRRYGTDDVPPKACMAKVTGPLRPSALHWASILSLPEICATLIGRGDVVNAPSVFGSPMYCAMMAYSAVHVECNEPDWPWRSTERSIRELVVAGVDFNNFADSTGHPHSVMGLAYRYWRPMIDWDPEAIRFIFEMNPKVSMTVLIDLLGYVYEGLEYVRHDDNWGTFDDIQAHDFLRWGLETEFEQFAPDTLPIVFTLVLHHLTKAKKPSTNLKCLFEPYFHKITRGDDRIAFNYTLEGQSGDWAMKLKSAISQLIRNSNETLALERGLMTVASAMDTGPYCTWSDAHCSWVLAMIQTLLYNDIKLDFNWRCTDETGDTIFHRLISDTPAQAIWWRNELNCVILKAVSQHGADLTVQNAQGLTAIELLAYYAPYPKCAAQTFGQIWKIGQISSAINRLPDLPRELLCAATRSPEIAECIFRQLAKDENTHKKLLRDFSVHHCTTDYMKGLFALWRKKVINEDDISTTEGKYSNGSTSVVNSDEADILIAEKENHDAGPSVRGVDDVYSYFAMNNVESTYSVVKEDKDTSPVELPKQTCPMVKMEVAFSIRIPGKGNQSLAMDKRKYADIHLLSGSHDPTNFGKLRLLLAQNSDLEVRDSGGLTPLAISIRIKNLRAMYALFIAGADFEIRVNHGQTCLHLACCVGNKEAVEALLAVGADVSIRDDEGNTAKDFAENNGRDDILKLFLEASLPRRPISPRIVPGFKSQRLRLNNRRQT